MILDKAMKKLGEYHNTQKRLARNIGRLVFLLVAMRPGVGLKRELEDIALPDSLKKDIKKAKAYLEERMVKAATVPGTLKVLAGFGKLEDFLTRHGYPGKEYIRFVVTWDMYRIFNEGCFSGNTYIGEDKIKICLDYNRAEMVEAFVKAKYGNWENANNNPPKVKDKNIKGINDFAKTYLKENCSVVSLKTLETWIDADKIKLVSPG